jgi:hypothetical protein
LCRERGVRERERERVRELLLVVALRSCEEGSFCVSALYCVATDDVLVLSAVMINFFTILKKSKKKLQKKIQKKIQKKSKKSKKKFESISKIVKYRFLKAYQKLKKVKNKKVRPIF